jgi:ABC-type sugar transport system permease subunit
MLFYHLYLVKYLCLGMLFISVFVVACAAQAYAVNSQRAEDDPEKKDFHLGALIFVFFTWPVLIPAVISLFVLRAFLYGVFLIVFTVLLVIMPRKLPEPTWLESKITKIGEKLLEANTYLINLMLRPWTKEPGTI